MTDSDSPPVSIGIDLGTTNCALSFVVPHTTQPQSLLLPQVVAPGEVASRPLLPSFLYFPSALEFHANALALPWVLSAKDTVGVLARQQGATTPMRLVSSAKSWLSNASVDRRQEILPWQAPEGVPKVSPLLASARYLAHVRGAWEHAYPETPLAEQDVVLTVPASFDAVAKELTLEAAALAGFSEPPRLLEEPQAAMYDWIAQQGESWRTQVSLGELILVIDIGGGTTDFSLIEVCEVDGALELERIAVGDHILLGGDNMDLALAHTVRRRLQSEGKELDDWQMRALTHRCRAAKEVLLDESPPESVPIAIPKRGSRLIGGMLRTELTLAEVQELIIAGFFPEVTVDARPQTPRRAGLTSLGLPYASDAAITRHLAEFLRRSAKQHKKLAHLDFAAPNAILFNGGVSRSTAIRERITAVLSTWLDSVNKSPPTLLEGTHAELAVSRGAAYYAHTCRHGGLRIRGGTAHAHYIGIERAELAIPGVPPALDALCIAPAGMEEGSELQLPDLLGLVLGETVSFRFFASAATARHEDNAGALVDPHDLKELSPLETTLDGPEGTIVQVRLQARVTEVGTLELSAVDDASGKQWKLSFNVRAESSASDTH